MRIKILNLIKKEPVLIVSAIFAVVSMFFVKPDIEYIEYFDFKVICLLFCLMAVVAGITECGVFDFLSDKLMRGNMTSRKLLLVLVLFPFFMSMLVTNDVALIMSVPFALTVLTASDMQKHTVKTVVLQTIAANLGSMATPVGNPQNLFLYSYYGFTIAEFIRAIIPYIFISLVLIILSSLWVKNDKVILKTNDGKLIQSKLELALYTILFVFSVLSVLNVISYVVVTAIVIFSLLIFGRKIFSKVDYFLLLTFLCFFVFSGNLGRIDAVSDFLSRMLDKGVVLYSALLSQVISNVPAAVLLSGFTQKGKELLVGVNIGGLGTPVASLASLISMKLYFKSENSQKGRYMAMFSIMNFAGLFIMIVFSRLLGF